MDTRVVSAVIFAIGIVIAAFIHGGLYHVVAAGGEVALIRMWRVNKFTGKIIVCNPGDNCWSAPDSGGTKGGLDIP